MKLYRAHKGLPKYKPLIKYLSGTGVKATRSQKTESTYMQDNNRRMPEITDDLFFVIDEKRQFGGTDRQGTRGAARTYFNEDGFFVLPDIGAEVAELEKSDLSDEERAQKRDQVVNDYSIKSERVHTHPPAAESLRHVRERRRIRGDGQQGENRRRADGAYPRRAPLHRTACTRPSRPRST